MALLKQDNIFTHVVAIDFGTGASGYAIAPKHLDQDGKIRIQVFNPCDGSDDQKTPTAILFSNQGQFLQFGINALQKYAEIVEDGNTALLFQNYKMHLLHMQKTAISVDGRGLPLSLVIKQTLKFISCQAINRLQQQVGKVILTKIRWVLTVPALWSQQHKSFMRLLAIQAGLIQKSTQQNLLLCLQPQGASIQCRQDAQSILKEQMGKDKVVMVLDCGGGTVDITVHRLMCQLGERFLCREIVPSSGGSQWGAKYVDFYFQRFLEEFLGQQLYDTYKENAIARLDILKDFQIIKRKFKGTKQQRSVIKLSYLSQHLNSKKLKVLIQNFNKNHSQQYHLKIKGAANLQIPSMMMMSFFQTLFQNIKNKVSQLLEQVQQKEEKVDFIFMVGGFSESPYLKSQILTKFDKTGIQVLVPRRPQISVVRGACFYGLNPRSITSRIAKKTYGINTLTVFDPQVHPQQKKVIIQGQQFCQDVFDAFVLKGDSVSIDQIHTKIYCPVRTRQTIMRIMFYETQERDAQFIDQEHVRQLGELAVDIGRQGDKTVKVTLMFGTTSIRATATNKDGTEGKNCQFRFQCN